ncbi:MAG: IS91 family transposase, partial [bacterium]|nr:IS91 family transposase [bacterium]
HPHLHCIVPGGGLSLDGKRWVASKRPKFLVSVKVLSALFRRLMLEHLRDAHRKRRLEFFGQLQALEHTNAFDEMLRALNRRKWYIHARAPFAGPAAVLAYLSRYTHRVAIANSRLLAFDEHRVVFRWKDYRAAQDNRYRTMALETPEFIRRFLIHLLPHGFHRIRYYGLFANGHRRENLATARAGLNAAGAPDTTGDDAPSDDDTPAPWLTCPACGQSMV